MGIAYLLKKVRNLLVDLPESSQGYEDLASLIQRAEKRMRIKPKCSYCGTVMWFRHSAISGGGFGGTPRGSPIRDDQGWKCPECFHTAHFGIPLTREEGLQEVRLRRGVYLTRPTFRRDEGYRRDVRKRLRELGYLDFDLK